MVHLRMLAASLGQGSQERDKKNGKLAEGVHFADRVSRYMGIDQRFCNIMDQSMFPAFLLGVRVCGLFVWFRGG